MREKSIDYLRAISIIFIVLYHFTTRYEEVINKHFSNVISLRYFCVGVAVFFTISGYLIKEMSFSKLIDKIVFRLYPSFIIAMLLTTVVRLTSNISLYNITIKQIIFNLTMVPKVFGVESIDGAYWSLFVTITFYIYMYWFYKFEKKYSVLNILIVWCIGSFILNFISIYVFDCKILYYMKWLLLSEYSLYFTIGFFLNYEYSSKNTRNNIIMLVLFFANFFVIDPIYLLFYGVIICLFVLLKKQINIVPKFIDSILLYISKVSYPLFLCHQVIGFIIIYKLENYNVNSYLAILLAFLVTIIIASLIHFIVEVNIINWRKKYKEVKL